MQLDVKDISARLGLKDPSLLRHQAYLAGAWSAADDGRTIDVLNPANGLVVGTVPAMGAAETRRAIEAAERAWPDWRARTAKERRTVAGTATAAQREVEHEIKKLLRTKGVRHIVGDGIDVLWRPVKGRSSFDWKGIREAAIKAGINLAEYETVGDPNDRLIIRVTGSPAPDLKSKGEEDDGS